MRRGKRKEENIWGKLEDGIQYCPFGIMIAPFLSPSSSRFILGLLKGEKARRDLTSSDL